MCDHHSESQFKQLRKKEDFGASTGFEPVASAFALQCSTSLSYEDPLKPRNPFFRAFSQLLKLRFTAMVTYSIHLYSRSSHHFIQYSFNMSVESAKPTFSSSAQINWFNEVVNYSIDSRAKVSPTRGEGRGYSALLPNPKPLILLPCMHSACGMFLMKSRRLLN